MLCLIVCRVAEFAKAVLPVIAAKHDAAVGAMLLNYLGSAPKCRPNHDHDQGRVDGRIPCCREAQPSPRVESKRRFRSIFVN